MTYILHKSNSDRAWENRSYLHKIHLFVVWHLSPVLYVYPKSVSFIEFLMDFCIYDDSLDTTLIADEKFSHFKISKSSQILRVGKTGFPSPRQAGAACPSTLSGQAGAACMHAGLSKILYTLLLLYSLHIK